MSDETAANDGDRWEDVTEGFKYELTDADGRRMRVEVRRWRDVPAVGRAQEVLVWLTPSES